MPCQSYPAAGLEALKSKLAQRSKVAFLNQAGKIFLNCITCPTDTYMQLAIVRVIYRQVFPCKTQTMAIGAGWIPNGKRFWLIFRGSTLRVCGLFWGIQGIFEFRCHVFYLFHVLVLDHFLSSSSISPVHISRSGHYVRVPHGWHL